VENMKNLLSKNNQVIRKLTNTIGYRIYILGIFLCFVTCFSLEAIGQSNKTTKPKSDKTSQTKANQPDQPSENQKTTAGQTNEVSKNPAASTNANQNKSGKIAIKEDEFTGKKTITLTEHSLSPTLTIMMTCSIPLNDNRSPMEKYLNFTTVTFISTSGKLEYRYGSELNFLVDGRQVKGNNVHSDLFGRSQGRSETVTTTLGFDVLTKVFQGSEVKMKLGDNILVLDNNLKKLIKELVNASK
jgi:hypothetical protein